MNSLTTKTRMRNTKLSTKHPQNHNVNHVTNKCMCSMLKLTIGGRCTSWLIFLIFALKVLLLSTDDVKYSMLCNVKYSVCRQLEFMGPR